MMRSKVGILLPDVGIYRELGVMLADALRGLGHQPDVRYRAHSGMLDNDILLLAGLCRYIEGLPEILEQRRGRVPATILWQLEPLPPLPFSTLGEEVGFRVAQCDWGRVPHRARRLLNHVFPFRTRLLRLARCWIAAPYSRQVLKQPDHAGWKEYHVENYFNAVADWRWIRNAQARGWLDRCFASVQPRVEFLRSRDVPAEMIPFGYHPGWGRDLRIDRDLDVVFLGKIDAGPRGAALRRLRDELARRGRTLTIVRSAHGEERERLLNRARIMLNLLRARHDLAGLRVLLGMACGALVVSEHCADTGAFQPGEHFVMAERERLADTIEHYLVQERERRHIADAGHQFVTQRLTLAGALNKMLELATQRSEV